MDMTTLTIKSQDVLSFTETARLLGACRSSACNLVTRHQLHPVLLGRNRHLLRNEVLSLKSPKEVG